MLKLAFLLLLVLASPALADMDACFATATCTPEETAAREARTQANLDAMRTQQQTLINRLKDFKFPKPRDAQH